MATITREQAKQIIDEHLAGRRAAFTRCPMPHAVSDHFRGGFREAVVEMAWAHAGEELRHGRITREEYARRCKAA